MLAVWSRKDRAPASPCKARCRTSSAVSILLLLGFGPGLGVVRDKDEGGVTTAAAAVAQEEERGEEQEQAAVGGESGAGEPRARAWDISSNRRAVQLTTDCRQQSTLCWQSCEGTCEGTVM
mmetsp:Transcript_33212/g.55592  ORF Transcript_33212/g.55592 Transcript_33212/m.55592 type:complete len:121 (+) Transcript_33212:44-406(+)